MFLSPGKTKTDKKGNKTTPKWKKKTNYRQQTQKSLKNVKNLNNNYITNKITAMKLKKNYQKTYQNLYKPTATKNLQNPETKMN